MIADYSSPNMPRYQLAKGCLVDQLVGTVYGPHLRAGLPWRQVRI
jgi:hypothetical protein